MKYVISNLSLLPSEREKESFINQVEKMVQKLKILPENYINSEQLKINISRINNFEYRVSCSLNMRNSLIFLTESGKDIKTLTNTLFDKFRKKLAVQLERNRVWLAKNKKSKDLRNFEDHIDELQEFRETKDEVSFRSLVKVLLPGLERYVERMLKSARMANLLKSGDVNSQDIIDEIILRTFITFEKNQDTAEDMNIWMMQATDEVLNELLDMSKHSNHVASYEDLVNSEYATLVEKISFDSSGDPVIIDEMDEFEQEDSLLGIEEAYLSSGSEKEMVDKISDKLTRKQMKELIRNELVHLPLRHQAVYDLFFFEEMDIEDIARIKSETPERIEEIIEEVKTYLTRRLSI